jgi:hypothetical protein
LEGGTATMVAKDISDSLLPKTNAWREIWLDGERVVGGEDASEVPMPPPTVTFQPITLPFLSRIAMKPRSWA